VSNGNKRNRGGNPQGGGGGNQQRRRRSGGQGGGQNRPQAPTGPAMTALGESTDEAVFDHGGQGYGVWFDGVVRDDPMYKQFWKGTGTRPLFVRIEEDKIVLLKQLDRELPPSMQVAATEDAESTNAGGEDVDVDAAIEEAVAEAMAAAEAAAAESAEGSAGDAAAGSDDKVYSPEEAAALFAAGDESGDAPDVTGEAEAEAPAKPKRKTAVRRKPAAKKPAKSDDE
jgi:hypothetical protein